MELTALATELAKPTYASMTDQEAANAINALTVSRPRLVETWEVKKAAIEGGYWAAIVMATEPGNPLQIPAESLATVRGLAISARDWIDDVGGKIQTLDFQLASVQTLVGGLVQTGLMTQEQANALVALGTETVSWPVANGYPEIGVGFVRNARNLK